MADRIIPGFTAEQSAALLRMFAPAESADQRDATTLVYSETLTARANQFLRASPGSEGMAVLLPSPLRTFPGDRVTISLESPAGPLRVACVPNQGLDGQVTLGLVNGASRATFSQAGKLEFVSNGSTSWTSSTELPAESLAARTLVSLGTAGVTGATGAQGIQGRPGFPGADGLDGVDGGPGRQGDTGPAGINGSTGATGPMGPSGQDGEQGERGDQGFVGAAGATGATGAQGDPGAPGQRGFDGQDGNDGADGTNGRNGIDGATGATGPAGSGTASGLAPFCFEVERADEPGEFIPRGLQNALAAWPRSGGFSMWIDAGRFVNFGLDGPQTSSPQITCGDAVFRLRGGTSTFIFADGVAGTVAIAATAASGAAVVQAQGSGGAALIQAANAGGGTVALDAATSVTIKTNLTDRWVWDSAGALTINGAAGVSGQVPTSAGPGSPVVWGTPSSGSAARDPLLALLTSVDEGDQAPEFIPRGFMGALAGGVEGGSYSPALQGGATSLVGGHYLIRGTTSGTVALSLGGVGNGGDINSPGGSLALTAATTLDATAASGATITHGAGSKLDLAGAAGAGGFLALKESAASTPALIAAQGMFWVRNDAPNIPMFKDDTNVDVPLKNAVAGKVLATTVSALTTVLPTVDTFTFPANSMRVGSVFHIVYSYLFVRSGAGAVNLSSFFDVVAFPSLTALATSATNGSYIITVEAMMTVLSTGAAGTAMGWITAKMANSGFLLEDIGANGSASFAINTTIAVAMRGAAQMSAAVAGTSITALGGTLHWEL